MINKEQKRKLPLFMHVIKAGPAEKQKKNTTFRDIWHGINIQFLK